MQRYGIQSAKAFGVTAPNLRRVAKEIGTDHALAMKLWKTRIHDARAVAALIADPSALTEQEADQWTADFDNWAICDLTCLALYWQTPFAWKKVRQWSKSKHEYTKRAAFALIAALAVHAKTTPDNPFQAALHLIEKASTDERNFVKKSVNWALRQIGKRNATLRPQALQCAEKLAAAESKTARWIGRDALRDI